MSLLFSMLFMSPFISDIKHRWFIVIYSCILLVSKQLRLFLNEIGIDTTGKDFFEYYSLIQFFIIVLAIIFLDGIQRIISIVCSISFALYSFFLYLFWYSELIHHYDIVAFVCVILHISLITCAEKSIIKNIIMLLFVGIATAGQERFI